MARRAKREGILNPATVLFLLLVLVGLGIVGFGVRRIIHHFHPMMGPTVEEHQPED